MPQFKPHAAISWFFLGFFMLFVWLAYIQGKQAAKSENLNNFTRLVIGLIGLKLFLAILIIAVYKEMMQPQDNNFAYIFFILYAVYSIFEFSILSRIGKTGK